MNNPDAERIYSLKQLLKIANIFLDSYKELKNQKSTWQKDKSEIAIFSLKEHIRQINVALHPKKLKSYRNPILQNEVKAYNDLLSNKKNKDSLALKNYLREQIAQPIIAFKMFDILYFAPENNIVYDINWMLNEYSVQTVIDIGLGKIGKEFISESLDGIIKTIEKDLLNYYAKQQKYSRQIELLKNAIDLSKKGHYLASNIILLTINESLTREICKFSYSIQNPNLTEEEVENYINNSHLSLEKLIEKGNFINDIPIPITLVMSVYKDVSDKHLNESRIKLQKHIIANQKIEELLDNIIDITKDSDELKEEEVNSIKKLIEQMSKYSNDLLDESDKTIKISITTKLNFLIRKYKDDRNNLLHGHFNKIDSKFKNCLNYFALSKIYKIDKEYKYSINLKKGQLSGGLATVVFVLLNKMCFDMIFSLFLQCVVW